MILDTVVLWLHVFAAIGWLGAVMVFGMVIGPSLSKLSGPSRTEFMAKVAPRFVLYIESFSVMTLIFGVAMVAVIADGNFSIFSLSTTLGLCISIGAALALVAVVLAFTVVVPATRRIIRISLSMMQNPGPPPPELVAASKRLRVGSTLAMVLLILVTVFMVAGATL